MNIKINHICPSFNNKIYQLLVEQQIKIGDVVRVFYFTQKNTGLPNGDKEYVDGVSPFNFFDRFFFFLKEAKVYHAYNEFYNDCKFDIIHAHTLFTSGYIAYKYKKKTGTPYVVAVRGTDVNLFFKRRIYLRRIGIRILLDADAVIFLSKAHMQEVLKSYVPHDCEEIIEQKIHIIPNGIDDFWHKNECMHTQNARDKIRIIYFGDIDKNKNISATIAACEILINSGYDIEYHVIGKVIDKQTYKKICTKQFIQYTSFLSKEELIYKLREADIFVMPSFSETFGLAYVEAMSQGIPVIYTKGQGFDNYYEDGYVGYSVYANNYTQIAESILAIMNNYQIISSNCIKESRTFDWTNIAKEYQNIYKTILHI